VTWPCSLHRTCHYDTVSGNCPVCFQVEYFSRCYCRDRCLSPLSSEKLWHHCSYCCSGGCRGCYEWSNRGRKPCGSRGHRESVRSDSNGAGIIVIIIECGSLVSFVGHRAGWPSGRHWCLITMDVLCARALASMRIRDLACVLFLAFVFFFTRFAIPFACYAW